MERISLRTRDSADGIFDTVDILVPIRNCQERKVKIFADGSGGKRTKDKRLRRCAWAWEIPEAESEKMAQYGARGGLGGAQTVARAELRVIHHNLLSLKEHATINCKNCHNSLQLQDGSGWY